MRSQTVSVLFPRLSREICRGLEDSIGMNHRQFEQAWIAHLADEADVER
jgi:hypothetical protein